MELQKKPGTYIGLNLSDQSVKVLKQLQKDLKITEEFPFHITLVYSRKKIKMDINKKVNKTIKAEKFHIFDNTKDGGDRALVIFFYCPYCEQRHNYAEIALGATWDYPSYEAHITLSYKWDGELPDPKLLDNLKINIVSEYEEELNLDWTDTNVTDSNKKIKTDKVLEENNLKKFINNPINKIKL